jgi:nicotinamide-nucleotide amidase
VRRVAGADLAIATSGVAGPDGGTRERPVGTVCIALSSEDVSAARTYKFWGNRDWVKLLTSQVALDWIRRYALGLSFTDAALFRR